MYYLAEGMIKTSMILDYTPDFIKRNFKWDKAIAFSSPYKKEVYYGFLRESLRLKDLITFFITEDEKICNLPFYFLLHDNEIIACAAQPIVNERLQPITINWYV